MQRNPDKYDAEGYCMNENLPVGVFDSGIGGLTVVKEIMSLLPNEKIIYFGDTARLPYGSKSKETIIAYSRQIIRFLLGTDGTAPKVKAIVIACNTASALALDEVAKETPVPVIGVVKPGARAAVQTTKNGKIGVIATEGTIRSDIYSNIIRTTNSDMEVYQKACPLFVPLVEEGWVDTDVARQVAEIYLAELKKVGIDALVLGCTHYPLIREVVRKVMGDDVALVNPAYETAQSLKDVLEQNGIQNPGPKAVQKDHAFYVSDGEEKFRQFANSILPDVELSTADVNLVDVGPDCARVRTKK